MRLSLLMGGSFQCPGHRRLKLAIATSEIVTVPGRGPQSFPTHFPILSALNAGRFAIAGKRDGWFQEYTVGLRQQANANGIRKIFKVLVKLLAYLDP